MRCIHLVIVTIVPDYILTMHPYFRISTLFHPLLFLSHTLLTASPPSSQPEPPQIDLGQLGVLKSIHHSIRLRSRHPTTHVQHCLQVSQTVPEVLTCTSAMVQKSIPTLISNFTTNCIAYKLVSQIVPACTSTESITISIPGIPNIIYYRGGKGHLIVLVVVIPSVHTYIFMMCPVLCSCTTVCCRTVEYNPNVYHTQTRPSCPVLLYHSML